MSIFQSQIQGRIPGRIQGRSNSKSNLRSNPRANSGTPKIHTTEKVFKRSSRSLGRDHPPRKHPHTWPNQTSTWQKHWIKWTTFGRDKNIMLARQKSYSPIIAAPGWQKHLRKRWKNPKCSENIRTTPNVSESIRMHPNVSECIRTCSNGSKHVQKLRKTSENFEKLCENFEKLREKFEKLRFLKFASRHSMWLKDPTDANYNRRTTTTSMAFTSKVS